MPPKRTSPDENAQPEIENKRPRRAPRQQQSAPQSTSSESSSAPSQLSEMSVPSSTMSSIESSSSAPGHADRRGNDPGATADVGTARNATQSNTQAGVETPPDAAPLEQGSSAAPAAATRAEHGSLPHANVASSSAVNSSTTAASSSANSSNALVPVHAGSGAGTPAPNQPHPNTVPPLRLLRSGMVVTLNAGGRPGPILATDIDGAFEGKVDSNLRLRAMLQGKGSHCDAVNLTQADPKLFNGKARYICAHGRPPSYATFFLLGMVTYNGLQDDTSKHGRQICIAPFSTGFSRAVAVLRAFSNEPYLYIPSYMRGLSITTGNFTSRATDDHDAFRCVLPKDDDIPVRDGREPFAWGGYLEGLPELDEDMITHGQICAVLFTINFYPLKQVKEGLSMKVKKAVSLNLQSIVLVDEANPYHAPDSIDEFHGYLDDDVEQDSNVTLNHAIKSQIVARPPKAMSHNDPDASIVA